ncbi:hypothetical protein ACFSTE_17850 [Aquimarina hainanensis]|uniref:Uncharacterized protein n=1 Tax=Aquimarina hainanensis TaxID=1578017 RepID=A0ABW5NB79_9FLAO
MDTASSREISIDRLLILKPAATKLILDPKADLSELIKLTLLDLLIKQVLTLKKVMQPSHARDPYLRTYFIVETGKNFLSYQPNRFETYFTDRIDKDSYFLLKSFFRAIYKEITSVYRYKIKIIVDLKMTDLFNKNLFLGILSILKTNHKGDKLKSEITQYLHKIDEELEALIKNTPQKALEILGFLQGHIFLLNTLKFELLETLKTPHKSVKAHKITYEQDWYWSDYLNDTTAKLSDIISEVSDVLDSIEDYSTTDTDGNWEGDHSDVYFN